MTQPSEYQHHTIWTPELVEMSMPLAGIARRCVGMLIDQTLITVFLVGLWIGVALILPKLLSGMDAKDPMMALGAGMFILIVLLFSILAYFIYFWGMHTFNNGQTIGKRCMGTRLVTDRGGRANGWTCFLRAVLDIVDLTLFYGGVSVLMIMMSVKEKRIADYAAGTLVILDRPTHNASI